MFNNVWYQSSLILLVLIKMSVVLLCSTMGTTFSASLIPRCPAHGYFSISSGKTESTSMRLSILALTTSPPTPLHLWRGELRLDNKTSLASSRLPMVALMPQMEIVGSLVGY